MSAASVTDSFLAGLISAVRDPDTHISAGDFVLHPTMSPDTIQAMVWGAVQDLTGLFSQFDGLFSNSVLARRELILSSKK